MLTGEQVAGQSQAVILFTNWYKTLNSYIGLLSTFI